MVAIAWLLVDFYDIQFIEQALHSEEGCLDEVLVAVYLNRLDGHDEAQLAERQEVDVFQQVLDQLDVGDVAGQLAVVDGLAGYLAVEQGKVDLRQVVAFLVLAVLGLLMSSE